MVKIKTLKENLLHMEEICVDATIQEFGQGPGREMQSREALRKKFQSELRDTLQFLTERIAKGFIGLRSMCLQKSVSIPSFAAHLQELNKIHDRSLEILQAWNSATAATEIPTIQEIAGINPEALDAFFDIAQSLMDEKRFQDAADVLFYLINLKPNDVNYLLALGSAEYHAGEFLRASAAFELAQLLDPQNPFPYLYAAHCRENLKQYEEALQLVELSLSIIENEPSLEDVKSDSKLLREHLQMHMKAMRKDL